MIGLLGADPFWQGLLRQEGVFFRTNVFEQLEHTEVLVLDRVPDGPELRAVRRFADAGGSIMAGIHVAAAVWPELKCRRARLSRIIPDGSPLFRNVGIVDLAGPVWIPVGANCGFTPRRRPAVFAGSIGRSHVVLLPFDLTKMLAIHDSAPRVFPSRSRRPVFETVARVNRGEVRRLVANGLRYLLDRKGLPYVRMSYVPQGNSSVFCFRVDTDSCPAGAVEAAAAIGDELAMRFTWFMNTHAAGNELGRLAGAALSRHDVQLHCFRHRVYPDYEGNRADIAKGIALLQEAGVSPVGIAAPYGQWNESWNRAASDAGLQYSSEFSTGYDDVPFRPVVDGKQSPVLQVPVHPICLGRLAAARVRTDEMTGYFKRVVDVQAARLEPCLLYDHPSALVRFPVQFEATAKYALERCGCWMTMTDYARWWTRREQVIGRVERGPQGLAIKTDTDAADIRLVIEQGGRLASVPVRTQNVKLDRLEWRPHPVVSHGAGIGQTVGPRVVLQELLRRGRRGGEERR